MSSSYWRMECAFCFMSKCTVLQYTVHAMCIPDPRGTCAWRPSCSEIRAATSLWLRPPTDRSWESKMQWFKTLLALGSDPSFCQHRQGQIIWNLCLSQLVSQTIYLLRHQAECHGADSWYWYHLQSPHLNLSDLFWLCPWLFMLNSLS